MNNPSQNAPTNARLSRAALHLRLAGVAAVIAAATVLGGCSTSEPMPGPGTEIEDVHLDAIREVVPDADLEYKKVTVPGQVEKVISPSAFSISDPDDPSVEVLLIVNQSGAGAIEPGVKVKVTGVVYRGFDVADVKRETGVELDEARHQEWEGESYIVASQVDPQK